MLLETVEVEARCLRRCLAELEREAGESPESDTPAQAAWQTIDHRLRNGEFDSLDQAVDAVFEAELVRRSFGPGPPNSIAALCVIEPVRTRNLVPGPVLLVDFADDAYGGPRFFRPVSDEVHWDTGAFS